ncbi:hypothetical protein, partial [Thalassovita autumnalis]|uniref:hypothetical protein n=1 Tax=Thalassovita autumnalis TaxID=2072972 RepID=UPI001A93BDAC
HKNHKKDQKINEFNNIEGERKSGNGLGLIKPMANITNPSAAVQNLWRLCPRLGTRFPYRAPFLPGIGATHAVVSATQLPSFPLLPVDMSP